MSEMNIGQVAEQGGISAKMIRHYESIGLLKPARRAASGYRVYGGDDVHTLRFIRQSRNLGFSMIQIKELLDLWNNQRRTSRNVKQLALDHIQDLDDRIRELKEIRQTLNHLISHCHGDDRPDCPILHTLAHNHQESSAGSRKKKIKKRISPGKRK